MYSFFFSLWVCEDLAPAYTSRNDVEAEIPISHPTVKL